VIKNLKYFIIFLSFCGFMTAQDFHLSMYDAAPLFLNPAMTGLIETKMRAHAQHRNQWNNVASKPFSTFLASFDVPKEKWGFGGQISNQRAGLGNYNALQLVGSAAYSVPLDEHKFHNLSLGIQAGFTQKRIEYQLLSFESQYTTASGGSFDKTLPNMENFQGQAFFQEVVNFGALYYFAKQQARFNPFLGISAFNLTKPKDSFIGGDARLPRRLFVHAGTRINLNEIFYVIPKVLVYTQARIIQQTYAVDAGYFFKGERFFALAGYTLRPNDASIIYFGLRKDNYIVRVSYDLNTSSLRGVSRARGAYEISITWLGRKAKATDIKTCPRL